MTPPPEHVKDPKHIALWYRAIAVLDKNRMEYEDPEKEAAVVASTIPTRLED